MKNITQQNFILSLVENIIRSNIYVFIFIRDLFPRFLSKYIYETDFKVLKYLERIKKFDNFEIIDIGGNDGISIISIRNFSKKKIISFEPCLVNFLKIINNKTFTNVKIINVGLSNKKNLNTKLYQAYFKNFHLSSFDSIEKKNVINHLNNSIFDKNNLKKIKIRYEKIKINKLDHYKTIRPYFIKIDIQGHEYECITGSLKIIKKFLPILMIEYEKNTINKIHDVLKKFSYEKFFYVSKKNTLILHNSEIVFNIFFIHKSHIKNIKKEILLKYDSYNT